MCNVNKNDNIVVFFQPVYLKCDIKNNAGIVNRVHCDCKLICVPSKTQNLLHDMLGHHLCVVSDECIPIVDTIIPDNTLIGDFKFTPIATTSTSLHSCKSEIAPTPQNCTESHKKTNKSKFMCKNISDKRGTNKNIFPVSDCICYTHKWKFPTITWNHNRRVRLKSNPEFNHMPLQRYQSHHSSSDEDWFEEVGDDEINHYDEEKNKCNSNGNTTLGNTESVPINLDSESDHIATNRFKWCSSLAFSKLCDKRPLTKAKIAHRDPKNVCRIT